MREPGEDCPECGGTFNRKGACRACGWIPARTPAPAPATLPAYREMPDRREKFQPCAHVRPGAEEPCAPCAAEIARLRVEFLRAGAKIAQRVQPILVRESALPDYDRLKAEQLERFRRALPDAQGRANPSATDGDARPERADQPAGRTEIAPPTPKVDAGAGSGPHAVDFRTTAETGKEPAQ